MAYEGIKNFVMRRLGYPVVKVYTTSEQIEDNIWEAINRYFEYRSLNTKWDYLSGTAGVNKYDIPPHIVPKFIRRVVFKPSDPLLSLTGVMQDTYILYYLQNAGGASNFIVDYWMTLASYEEYVRVLGNQPHYQIIEGNKLLLDPTPSVGFNIGIEHDTIPDESVIENIRWIRLYTLALTKQVEGEIRSKFSSFQAGSGEVSLNGDTLKTEAQAEIEALKDENFQKQDPLEMIFG
jgi:hypothetical protein